MRNVILLLVFCVSGQTQSAGDSQTKSAPVQALRSTAPGNSFDFGPDIMALQQDPPQPSNAPPPAAHSANGSTARPPKDFKPKTDVTLTPTAQDAVRMSEKWMAEANAPAAGPDGRVLYSYGAGLPTIVCAPLRVCIIELQAGERIVGEPQIGDSVRWNVSPAMYGRGDETTSIIVLKPQASGLDTNLLITTDRRAYYLRLLSKPEEYVARVAFAYPEGEDNERKWQEQLARQRQAEQEAQRESQLTPAMLTVEKMNFDYRVKGGDETTRPLRVFDDGAKTYIQMSPNMKNGEAPALLIIGSNGKGEMVNYRVKEQTYIVDRLFERAELVLGSGKKAQKVEISRGSKG